MGFTLARYGGLFEDGSDDAVDRLDALLQTLPERKFGVRVPTELSALDAG